MGVAPLHRDPRVTRWGFYMWHFRFLPEPWEGVTRDDFLRALRAEGLLRRARGTPSPSTRTPSSWTPSGPSGAPASPSGAGSTRGGWTTGRWSAPQTERIYATEAVHLGHPLFLGPPEDMDAILGAIEKVWRHRDALRENPAPGRVSLGPSPAVRDALSGLPAASSLSRRRAGAGPGRPSCRRG